MTDQKGSPFERSQADRVVVFMDVKYSLGKVCLEHNRQKEERIISGLKVKRFSNS